MSARRDQPRDHRLRNRQISRWRDQVKTDGSLTRAANCFKVAYQLSMKTNADEFDKSGRLVTWQGIKTLAMLTALSERTVFRAIRHLQANGHVSIESGGGRHRSNCYTLTEAKNPVRPVRVLETETLTKMARNPDNAGAKPCQDCHPNLLINNNRTYAPTTDTELGAPRQRAVALGAPSGKQGGLGELGEEVRKRIDAANFDAWLGNDKATFVSLIDDTVTIAVQSKFIAREIANRFEREIVEAAGVKRLNIEVRPAPKAAPQ
jgi:hypothetical protein